MIEHDKIPRDENGVVQGLWRIVHRSPTYSGPIGFLEIRGGVSTAPAFGRATIAIAAEYGNDLYLEPWDDAVPFGVDVPEFISRTVSPDFLATLDVCPWRVPAPAVAPATHAPMASPAPASEAPADSLDDMGRDDLIALADLHEIDIDRRWGDARLRAVLRSAGATD